MKTTKELAGELGLIRRSTNQHTKRITDRASGGNSLQLFNYLVVIDFESTCWEDKKPHRTPEIIEFPAVLLNTSTGEIEAEFQHYVQPQEHPGLSAFCSKLTGISQAIVDQGIPITICLNKFTTWLNKLALEKQLIYNDTSRKDSGKTCTFVTWSDWDLGVCLQYECQRKQLRIPSCMNSWIDLRYTYRTFYERKPNGLNGALQGLGMAFTGREHSGLDDARNTAKLAWRMARDGCALRITKTVNRTDDRSLPLQLRPPLSARASVENSVPMQGMPPAQTHCPPSTTEDTGEITPKRLKAFSDKTNVWQNLQQRSVYKFSTSSASRKKYTFTSIMSSTPGSCSKPKSYPTPLTDKVGRKDNVLSPITPASRTSGSTVTHEDSLAMFNSGQNVKTTPPLCDCGRRTRRRVSQRRGPNEGRTFYSCPLTLHKGRCAYFKWEILNMP